MEKGAKPGWRDAPVYVLDSHQKVVYEAPPAGTIRPMLDDLFEFLALDDIHPVIKACAAHIYFVTVHPLFDGNGRTARALAYMILLQAGYDFLRQTPISGLLARERPRYYRAIRASQDPDNGCDLTYFMVYYADMLARSVESMHDLVRQKQRVEELRGISSGLAVSERLCEGLEWLYRKEFTVITTEKWKDRFAVSFETARKDLRWLAEHGYLKIRAVGHRKMYDVT